MLPTQTYLDRCSHWHHQATRSSKQTWRGAIAIADVKLYNEQGYWGKTMLIDFVWGITIFVLHCYSIQITRHYLHGQIHLKQPAAIWSSSIYGRDVWSGFTNKSGYRFYICFRSSILASSHILLGSVHWDTTAMHRSSNDLADILQTTFSRIYLNEKFHEMKNDTC